MLSLFLLRTSLRQLFLIVAVTKADCCAARSERWLHPRISSTHLVFKNRMLWRYGALVPNVNANQKAENKDEEGKHCHQLVPLLLFFLGTCSSAGRRCAQHGGHISTKAGDAGLMLTTVSQPLPRSEM